MSNDENNKKYIAYLRGLILTWVIAFPLAILLYGNFPETSIAIIAIAIVITNFVVISFPYRKKKKVEHSQVVKSPGIGKKSVSKSHLFLIKLDRFIFWFMHTMSGTFLIIIGNMLAFAAMYRISKNSVAPPPHPTVQAIFIGMVISWFILGFLRTYMKKYHPDYLD